MSIIADLYRVEAIWPDARELPANGDLSGAVKVSLIPKDGIRLPRHDLIGLPFVRRFKRYFKRVPVLGFNKAAYFKEMESKITEARKDARNARNARKTSTPVPFNDKFVEPKLDECVNVICLKNARLYICNSNGSVLVTPPDYELYL